MTVMSDSTGIYHGEWLNWHCAYKINLEVKRFDSLFYALIRFFGRKKNGGNWGLYILAICVQRMWL